MPIEEEESPLVRFINNQGWERWITVSRPFPLSMNVPDEPVSFQLFSDPAPLANRNRMNVRLFYLEKYHHPTHGYEPVYFEDGCSYDHNILTQRDRPSIYRERFTARLLHTLLAYVKLVVETNPNGVGQSERAAYAMQRLEQLVNTHVPNPNDPRR